MTEKRPLVAITMGDPAGIGPELCLRVLRDPQVLQVCRPFVFGDAAVLEKVAEETSLPGPTRVVKAGTRLPLTVPASPAVVDLGLLDGHDISPGRVQAACGRASAAYLEAAVDSALRADVDAIATAPINKEAWHRSAVPFAGHTEMLASLTNTSRYCLMLYSDQLAVSMVTTHIGLGEVSGELTTKRILEVIRLTAEIMAGVKKKQPRIGVLGLNPHCGEARLFGHGEEERFIQPAIQAARKEGIRTGGPLVPDAAFVEGIRQEFDALVCMYHDQGHIPFKMLAFRSGVNLTLGLPIVRTSVVHGTAFDIAWKGRASPASLISSVVLGCRLAGLRRRKKLPVRIGAAK